MIKRGRFGGRGGIQAVTGTRVCTAKCSRLCRKFDSFHKKKIMWGGDRSYRTTAAAGAGQTPEYSTSKLQPWACGCIFSSSSQLQEGCLRSVCALKIQRPPLLHPPNLPAPRSRRFYRWCGPAQMPALCPALLGAELGLRQTLSEHRPLPTQAWSACPERAGPATRYF